MLNHSSIKIILNSSFDEYKNNWRNHYKKLVFSGSLDEYYNYEFGLLPYRTIRFREIRDKDIIGSAVLNFTDMKYPYTRIHEHKWFTPLKKYFNSIAYEEYSDSTDSRYDPYYPIREVKSDRLFTFYNELAKKEKDVIFVGRLAEFRYYDMHQVIGSSIKKFKKMQSLKGI